MQIMGSSDAGGMPAILTGEKIYNRIMAKIDEDLTTSHLQLLPEKYKNETKTEAITRAERYNKAFTEYAHRFSEFVNDWNKQFNCYRRKAMQYAEKTMRSEDESRMNNTVTFSTQS